jgi:hypothetical protein
MDNGLIFPYPCIRAHDESVVLIVQNLREDLRVSGEGLHETPAGSSQAMG